MRVTLGTLVLWLSVTLALWALLAAVVSASTRSAWDRSACLLGVSC